MKRNRILAPAFGIAFAFIAYPAFTASAAEGSDYLLYDKYISAPAGAEDMLTLHHALYSVEDRILAPDWGNRGDTLGFGLPLAFRAAKGVLLDFPLDDFPSLIEHEAFGHGYRLQEFGASGISVTLHIPPPWGDGHGVTSARNDRFLAPDAALGLYEGGVEAQQVMSDRIRDKWLLSGRMNYHDADMYLVSTFSKAVYVARTRYGNPVAGNDILNYLGILNFKYHSRVFGDRPIDLEDLQYRVLLDALDPFAYFALWNIGKYLWTGRAQSAYPVLTAGGTGFLPGIRSGFTPFGPEYYLEGYFLRGGRVLAVYYRQGDPEGRFFCGAGFHTRNFAAVGRLKVDASADFWRQPGLALRSFPFGNGVPPGWDTPTGGGPGASAWLSLLYPPLKSLPALGLALDLGYKTRGFVAGEDLESGTILRAGFAFGAGAPR